MSDDLSPGQRDWFNLQFRVRFAQAHGQSFQDFFAELMEKAYPGDFVRVRAHGRLGDGKCDGHLPSGGLIFQLYASQSLDLKTLQQKIATDFAGALIYWGDRMRAWALVYNHGLPAPVVQQLDDLRAAHPQITITHWDQEQLRCLLDRMSRRQLEALFGRAPEARDFQRLGFPEIAPLVRAIEGRLAAPGTPLDGSLAPVPVAKLEINALSPASARFIRLGRESEQVVEEYFGAHYDPTLGERVAAGYRAEYVRLRREGWGPDGIFARLVDFSGGASAESGQAAAVYTILAYFFERCDIFESAPTLTVPTPTPTAPAPTASSDAPADQAPS